MRLRILIPLVSFLFLALLATLVHAMLASTSISELTKAADAVVTGTVVDIESQWDVEHKTIFTYVTVQVDQVVKNSTPKKKLKEITLRLLGGTVGDTATDVSDMPKFSLNERVFLFLSVDTGVSTPSSEGDRLGDFTVYGWEMGKFTISDGLVEIIDGKNRIRGKMPLGDFVKDIETILSGSEQAPSFMDPKNLR